MADHDSLKLSIDWGTTFDPCSLPLDSTFKKGAISYKWANVSQSLPYQGSRRLDATWTWYLRYPTAEDRYVMAKYLALLPQKNPLIFRYGI